jgi:catechol 2,3-dioxygenase-like lactoylglutathione lyase family enzyme
MPALITHLGLNISDPSVSIPFYRDFFEFLEFGVVECDEKEGWLTVHSPKNNLTFELSQTLEQFRSTKTHSELNGLNHFAFLVESRETVDKLYEEFVKPRNLKVLFDTPRAFPEYTEKYYAIFFEDPDGMKIEVCFGD